MKLFFSNLDPYLLGVLLTIWLAVYWIGFVKLNNKLNQMGLTIGIATFFEKNVYLKIVGWFAWLFLFFGPPIYLMDVFLKWIDFYN